MKRFFLIALLLTAMVSVHAQSLTMAQPSPSQIIKQNFGLGSIELSYSRPGLKGRHVGAEIAPYGKVWRTGANGATTITFSDDVTIGGTSVKAGKYGVLSIPGASEWILIITKDLNVNNPALYKQENDVLRLTAPVTKIGDKVETFTINFANITNGSCDLQLTWENSCVALPIKVNTDDKVMAQINDILIKDSKPYYAAAQYYYDNGKDLTKAKEWIYKAAADPANARSINVFWLKAQIDKKSGDKAAAKADAEKVIALATETKNDDFTRMGQDFLKGL